MAVFPAGIASLRALVNRAGAVYDVLKTKVFYAEDQNLQSAEIVAIENTLGINPEGAYTTVGLRISAQEARVIPVKATGAEVVTGTNDTKFATPKALDDAGIAFLSDIPTVPVKATSAEVLAMTNDTKFATPLSLATVTAYGWKLFNFLTLVLDQALISYWKMENGTNDQKAVNNGTGTALSYASANGVLGFGADFNGSTSKMALANGGGIANAWTLSLFIKFDAVSGAPMIIHYRPASGDANEIRLKLTSAKLNVYCMHSSGSGTGYKDYSGGTTLTTGVWYMLSATWDGTNLKLYLNGVAETLTKINDQAVTMTDTTRVRMIGADTTSGNFVDGSIDEIMMFNRTLTVTELLAIYDVIINHP